MPIRMGGPRGFRPPPRGPRRPHMHHRGGCNFIFIPSFLFRRGCSLVVFGIVFALAAVMFLVVSIVTEEWFLIAFAVAFLIAVVVTIITSVLKKKGKNGSHNDDAPSGENVTTEGETTFVDNTNYRSYESRADALARSRTTDPFASGPGQSGQNPAPRPTSCPGCGSPINPTDKFCENCGRRL